MYFVRNSPGKKLVKFSCLLITDDICFGKILFFCSFIAPPTHVISLLLNPQEFS